MRICGKLFAFVSCVFVCGIAYAEITVADRKTVSSKAYVDTEVGTRQPLIPATNPDNETLGVSVVTYTETGNGTIGERGIYNNPNSYTENTDANKLVTASALKGSVANLPTLTTSKLTCANPGTCTLWTVQDQQVYGDEDNNNSSSNNSNNSNNGDN